MTKPFAALLLVFANAHLASSAPERDTRRPTVPVNVETHADMPAGEVKAALDQATRAFRAIGITLEWRSGPTVGRPGELVLIMLSPEMADRKCAVDGVGPSVLGTSAPPAGRAWIFIERIANVARGLGLPVSDILGQVVTHELGHLLLSDRADESGIMREQVQLTGATSVRFTRAQGARMRRALAPPAELLAGTRAR